MGDMIAGALDKVGAEGVLSIENSNSMETSIEVQEGMLIDRGYISPQFITNNERMTVEFENCLVVVADSKVDAVKELVPLLEQVMQSNKPLLIVCEDITGEALATLVVNKLRGIIQVAAIKAPGFGERRKALLQDIAIVTGADYLATDLGLSLETATMDNLGTARKVTITKTECTLIADQASAEDISARVAQIKKELSETDSTYDTEKLSERIAKLAGGVAVIKVGAATETELEDRKLRVEDAKNATFAAVEEGVVPGGGATLLHLRDLLPKFKETLPEEEKAGAEILYKALTAPCRIIADNSGSEGEVVVEKVSELPFEEGYNAMSQKYENLLEGGVLDPAKVTRSVLQNSVGVAGIMLTTQAVIVDKPKKSTGGGGGGSAQPNMGMGPQGMPAGMTV